MKKTNSSGDWSIGDPNTKYRNKKLREKGWKKRFKKECYKDSEVFGLYPDNYDASIEFIEKLLKAQEQKIMNKVFLEIYKFMYKAKNDDTLEVLDKLNTYIIEKYENKD